MKQRIISGIVYAALLLGFFLVKIFVPQPWGNLGFDVLIYFCSLVGTWEMLRAMDASLAKGAKGIVAVFSVICIPICSIGEAFWGYGIHVIAICFFVLALALISLLIFKNEESTMENIGSAFVCALYPTLLLFLLMLANHLGEDPIFIPDKLNNPSVVLADSTLAICFIFVVSPLSDVAAFFTGMSLRKKFPKKLAPTISPNKTVVGFIGGLVGGMLAGAGIYFAYNAICGSFENMHIQLPVYILVGLLSSLASCFGDLVESAIKRQRGLKDMGNIMPGHGGVLDRIDSTLFSTVVVYVAFVLVNVLAV
jgi:phosphatidate cytidylyltransferase